MNTFIVYRGIVSEEIMEQVHINRFKKLFGNNIELVRLRAKFKYSRKACGLCVRDLLTENIPFYINMAVSCPKPVIKEYLANAFRGNIRQDSQRRHLRYTPCVRNLNSTVNLIRGGIPRDTVVEHKIHWKLFPSRRIFSVTATLFGYDGKVYSYYNTYTEFLKSLEETDSRIKADHLRILRYFRIYGRVMNGDYITDERSLNIIKSNISGLDNVQGDLIWNEMRTILQERMRVILFKIIFDCGGFKHIGLPENVNFDEFENVSQNSRFDKHPLLAITYLSALLTTLEEVLILHKRLKLTSYERDLACFLVTHRTKTRNIDDFGYYEQMCLQPIRDGFVYFERMCLPPIRGNKNMAKEYVLELLKYNNKSELFNQLMLWW